ncbi:hypothetical protein [Paenibacillus sp. HB172176]|uniref:hypothetical protein n=1 Tax=Paenibacillus sp. HB172176 TaxID=2493690 RepID=UPI00143B69A7|nr:hypothetical protein [Paenibacillus sp. HB172176]
MNGRLLCLILLLILLLARDIRGFKKSARRERIVYAALWLPLLYLGLLFVAELPWPNLNTIFDLFAKPASRIVQWLKA